MVGQILFTIVAFILFIYILLLKLIKKNDTTYLTMLCTQAIGIFLNLIKIYFDVLNRNGINNYIVFFMYNLASSINYIRKMQHKCIRTFKYIVCPNLYFGK